MTAVPRDPVIAFQLYSLRGRAALADRLAPLRAIGYAEVETTRREHDDPIATRALLDAYGLAARSGHFSLEALTQRTLWVCSVARTIGLEDIVFHGPFDHCRDWDGVAWAAAGRCLGDLAHRFGAQGLRFAFHNHDDELRHLPDGRTALEHLFAGAGDAPLSWQADIGWLARSGEDPRPLLRAEGHRLLSCHVKDLALDGDDETEGWAVIGQGRLDWAILWPFCLGFGPRRMIAEHDAPGDAVGFARASFDYLTHLRST